MTPPPTRTPTSPTTSCSPRRMRGDAADDPAALRRLRAARGGRRLPLGPAPARAAARTRAGDRAGHRLPDAAVAGRRRRGGCAAHRRRRGGLPPVLPARAPPPPGCLLYTSDAADDLTRVDLGGRRIIK